MEKGRKRMIRFGIIGAGNITRNFCVAFKGIEDGCLYAIASRSLQKAKEYKETYNIEKAYGSYLDMLKDPLVDCVYVATPHGLHYEHMMLILDFGKHILCEKAFTLNQKQAQEVFLKAKSKKLFVMEAMWTRFLPLTKALIKEVRNGIIGDIVRIDASLCFNLSVDDQHRVLAKHLGGGALLDVGIYPITYANLFLGKPLNIESKAKITRTGVDGSNEIVYHYENAKAYLKSSVVEEGLQEALIHGSKGRVRIPLFWCAEKAMVYNHHNQHIKTLYYPHDVNGYEYEIRETIHLIKSGFLESTVMSHETTLEIMRQMDAIRQNINLVYPHEEMKKSL